MKKITLLILLFTSITSVYAGNQTGKVSFVKIRDDGLIKVGLDTVWENRAACVTKLWWIIKDENSQAGQAQLSLLLTAHASGRTVKIGGAPNGGTCIRTPGEGEDIRNLNMVNY